MLIGKRFRIIALAFEPEASQGIIIRGQENILPGEKVNIIQSEE